MGISALSYIAGVKCSLNKTCWLQGPFNEYQQHTFLNDHQEHVLMEKQENIFSLIPIVISSYAFMSIIFI